MCRTEVTSLRREMYALRCEIPRLMHSMAVQELCHPESAAILAQQSGA